MIRRQRGGKLEPVSWDEALNYVAERLSAIKRSTVRMPSRRPASSRGTGNETNYVMQKFARAVIGTNNVDCCALCLTRPIGCRSAPIGSVMAQ